MYPRPGDHCPHHASDRSRNRSIPCSRAGQHTCAGPPRRIPACRMSSELVESELVELRGGTQADDARIRALSVAVASAREEVLAPPELHFVEVQGMRIRAN